MNEPRIRKYRNPDGNWQWSVRDERGNVVADGFKNKHEAITWLREHEGDR
jgi:hypothetical protein